METWRALKAAVWIPTPWESEMETWRALKAAQCGSQMGETDLRIIACRVKPLHGHTLTYIYSPDYCKSSGKGWC
jgi:hypothetical protein